MRASEALRAPAEMATCAAEIPLPGRCCQISRQRLERMNCWACGLTGGTRSINNPMFCRCATDGARSRRLPSLRRCATAVSDSTCNRLCVLGRISPVLTIGSARLPHGGCAGFARQQFLPDNMREDGREITERATYLRGVGAERRPHRCCLVLEKQQASIETGMPSQTCRAIEVGDR